jgi:hypothetical protein
MRSEIANLGFSESSYIRTLSIQPELAISLPVPRDGLLAVLCYIRRFGFETPALDGAVK